MRVNKMKLYKKPALDITVISSADIVNLSGGGLAGKFTEITGSETNSIEVDSLN